MSQSAERSLLEDVLKALPPPNTSDGLLKDPSQEEAESQKVIQEAIEKHSTSLSDASKAKLLLLGDLINKLDLPSEICKDVILQSECQSLQAVAAQFWENWNADPERQGYATKLFEAEAAVILKALVAGDRFKLPLSLQEDTVKILEHLVSKVDILRDALPPDHEAIAWLNDLNDPGRKKTALDFLASIQKLSRVIVEPLNLPILLSLGFSSSDRIAYMSLDVFQSIVTLHGISAAHAKRIHAEAAYVQLRVEQSMMTLLQGTQDHLAPKVVKQSQQSSSSSNQDISSRLANDTGSRRVNLATWFGDLDQVSCDDCNSVTGPAAYLVDLFRLLKNIHSRVPEPWSDAKDISLLDKLFERRPDLGDLLLSCRNTSELVPYIDLVNETLESAVVYLQGKNVVQGFELPAYNSDSHPYTHDAAQLPQDAANIRHELYDQIISKRVYPSVVFPYDHSHDSLQKYLKASGTTPAKLLNTFRSNPRLALDEAFTQLVKDQAAVDSVYSRAHAAEVLGMSLSDYVAVTSESFYDLRSARLVENNNNLSLGDYQRLAGLLPAWHYWGYEEGGQAMLLDATNGNGLPFIKKQLLPRLSVDFSTLVQILNTRFMARSLTVALLPQGETIDADKNVPTKLDGYRLRGRDGRQLDMDSCRKLDQFARVWRRLGWDIEAVDDAIYSLTYPEAENLPAREALTITPTTIEQLAAVSEIVELADSQPPRVVSLFSLTSNHLLNLPIVQAMLAQNTKGSGERWVNYGISLSVYESEYYLSLLLMSLNLSYDDYLLIQETEGLGEELTIPNIFKYNRLAEAARMFSVTVAEIQQLLAIISDDPALESPQAFVRALKTWKQLHSDGWNVTNLISVSTRLHVQTVEDPEVSSTEFIGTLLDSIRSVKIALSSSFTQQQDLLPSGKPSAVPEPSDTIAEQSILAAVRDRFPNVPPETIEALLKKPLGGNPALISLILPATERSPINYGDVDFTGALFFAEDTVIHIETSLRSENETTFIIGNVRYELTRKENSNTYECKISVSASSAIYLSWPSHFYNTHLSLYLPDGQPSTIEPHPLTTEIVLSVQHALDQILQYSLLLGRYPLNVPELDILSELAFTVQGFDIVLGLQGYASARKTLAKPKKESDFARLIQRLLQYQKFPSDLASQFNQATILSKSMAEKLLRNNLPDLNITGQDLKPRLEAVRNIGQQVQLMAGIGLKGDSLELLFQTAQPPQFRSESGLPAPDRKQRPVTRLVRLLRAALVNKGQNDALGTAQDALRDNRRRALIHYLLQHPAIKAKGVIDEDSLFEIFLIDVQMGAGLETTRIRQAISTVHLFVHRCLIRMEEDVDPSLIPQDRWAWMSRYNVWEANRKVFLYPENWADPTLRDNKTEVFRSMEESAMQHNLDEKAIHKLIRSYAQDASNVSNLEIQAFYWERTLEFTTPDDGSIHFIARTRNVPYEYYYRQAEFFADILVHTRTTWSAWEKLPFDVPSYDVDYNGHALDHRGSYVIPVMWNKRLIIFVPQILVVTEHKEDGSSRAALQTNQSGNLQQIEISGGNSSVVQTNLEIKMTWSELIDGVWSPQQQSQDACVVAGNTRGTPTISQFRFTAETTPDSLSIGLYFDTLWSNANWPQPEERTRYTRLGHFVHHGPSMSFTRRQVSTSSFTAYTFFEQVMRTGSQLPRFPDSVGAEEEQADELGEAVEGRGNPQMTAVYIWPPRSSALPIAGYTIPSNSHNHGRNPQSLVLEYQYNAAPGHEPWLILPRAFSLGASQSHALRYSTQLYNHLDDELRAALTANNGIDSLFQVLTDSAVSERNPALQVHEQYNHIFGRFGSILRCREDGTPAALYNWELGFHAVSLIVERLMSLQDFELAIKYAHLVFDPTGTESSSAPPTSSQGLKPRPIWRFPPFRDAITRSSGSLDTVLNGLKPSTGSEDDMADEILAWIRNPFQPHTVARGRPIAYMKRFVIKYIEALIGSGDVYFRQNSLETIHSAIQRYIEASHIFGPAPETVPGLGQRKLQSYNGLADKLDDFSNASVELELSFPYYVPFNQRGLSQGDDGSRALHGFVLTSYFCVQANPEFMELRHKIDDRLFKIRNSLDINGNPRVLSIWDPPLDVGNLVSAAASGPRSDMALIISGFPKVMPKKRFMYLMQKSYELCEELKKTSARLLAAVEKEDHEALQLLRSSQETGMQRILLEIKLQQKKEAQRGLEQLEEVRKSAVMRLKYYVALTGDDVGIPTPTTDFNEVEQEIPKPTADDLRLTPNEVLELEHGDRSSYYTDLAISMDRFAASFFAIPMPELNMEPMGIGMSIAVPHIGQAFEAVAYNHRVRADDAADEAESAATIGRWTTRLQERRLQLNLAGREIKSIDKKIETQAARIAAIDKEIESQNKIEENLIKVQDFLTTKFSNKELYAWYENSTRTYLYQTYLVAMELVRQVEVAYMFETGPTARSTLASNGYWDQGKRGLQCGEQLWFALKQLELAYLNETRHDFELTKTFSLKEINPQALQAVRETGQATFELSELCYDLEFPGHYFRRLKSVGFSFVDDNSDRISANCSATLLEHRYRANGSAGGSYPEQAGDRDPRFVYQDIQTPITSIATAGQDDQDSGRFEINLRGDSYLPFEGAGAISRWRLRLPSEFPKFKFSTISDVLIRVKYTAKNGGDTLYAAAVQGIRDTTQQTARVSQKHNMQVSVDLRHENLNSWHQFREKSDTSGDNRRILEAYSIRDKMPYFARRTTIKVTSVTLYCSGPDVSNCKFDISSSRDGPVENSTLEYAGKLGDAQLFQVTSRGGPNENLNVVHSGDAPWYLRLQSANQSPPPIPSAMHLIVHYALAV